MVNHFQFDHQMEVRLKVDLTSLNIDTRTRTVVSCFALTSGEDRDGYLATIG